MRAISIAAVSALALLTASAQAQSPATSPAAPRPGAMAPMRAKVAMQNPLKQEDVSKIEGTSVLGSDGKKIGDVSTVLMQPDEKKIDRLVIHVGGLLGLGGRHVAMPLKEFSWEAGQGAFKIGKTANELNKMAEWKEPLAGATASGSSQPSHAAIPPSRAGK
jgi:sporulation protein YlmC with PRC-barrel domain